MGERRRSAVVFGARNLGRAVIELLGTEGWAVTGVARSDATLEAVTATGALALRADVTDQESVTQVLEQAAAAHGGVDLVVNAASAYGGDRSGPFGGGPVAEAPREAFDAWAAAPARSAFSFLSAAGRFLVARGLRRRSSRSRAAPRGGRQPGGACGLQVPSASGRSRRRQPSSCAGSTSMSRC